MKKIYFNGLNELRAIAALGVVTHHIEQIKSLSGFVISNSNISFFIHNLGKASVNLFFILSGFLITYLLLQEKTNNNEKINIIKFYLRRIFKIWPLYYLIMLISFILIPILSNYSIFDNNINLLNSINNIENYTAKNLGLYLFFLPQFAKTVIGASQVWSIGLEEQFYLIVPLGLSFLNKKMFFYTVIIISILYLSLIFQTNYISSINNYTLYFIKFLKYFNFQYLCIGVIGGYLFFYNVEKITILTRSKYLYLTLLLSIFFLSYFLIFNIKLNHFILGIIFLLLIFFTINPLNTWSFKNKYLSYLGKISYGIYMYHVFVIFLVYPFANKYFLEKGANIIQNNLFLYFFCYLITIVLSIVSYEFFESKFIKIKDNKYKV